MPHSSRLRAIHKTVVLERPAIRWRILQISAACEKKVSHAVSRTELSRASDGSSSGLLEFFDGDIAELHQSRWASPHSFLVLTAVMLQVDAASVRDARQLRVLENLFAVEFHP